MIVGACKCVKFFFVFFFFFFSSSHIYFLLAVISEHLKTTELVTI